MNYILGFILSLGITLPAYYKRALTGTGVLAAVVLGTLLYGFGEVSVYLALIAFFGSSTVISKVSGRILVKRHEAEGIDRLHEKGDRRDHTQAIANGGVALLCAVLYQLFGHEVLRVGAIIGFAAANADTWASEIGVLSKETPVNIIARTPVPKGLSGGVTRLGFLASLAGAGFIAGTYVLTEVLWGKTELTLLLVEAVAVTGFGFLGSVIDSVIGEKWQAKYLAVGSEVNSGAGVTNNADVTNGPDAVALLNVDYLTERADGNRLVLGIKKIDNNVVNFISGLFSALLGMAVIAGF